MCSAPCAARLSAIARRSSEPGFVFWGIGEKLRAPACYRATVGIIDGEPWFIARDLAAAIGYTHFSSASLKHVPKEWKGRIRFLPLVECSASIA
ncbi:Bro-N domain-containing protein [Burkholderia vietnamiensis]|uniref:BRO-N domain-containing protein n=1 Tax=Burkholderia vietnamiensis TaxID=60552 RepID=UPI001B90F31E|nr:Bro-N domain-containing protein [Burkholderia vietnamiensis]